MPGSCWRTWSRGRMSSTAGTGALYILRSISYLINLEKSNHISKVKKISERFNRFTKRLGPQYKSMNEWMNQSINQPTNQPTNEWMNESSNKPIRTGITGRSGSSLGDRWRPGRSLLCRKRLIFLESSNQPINTVLTFSLNSQSLNEVRTISISCWSDPSEVVVVSFSTRYSGSSSSASPDSRISWLQWEQ